MSKTDERPASRVDQPQARPLRRRRVLIIEDNVDAAEGLRDALQLSDHQVDVAHDGHEGLAKVRQLHPDAVLCDISLPGMSGYEVASAIKADASLQGIVLIALSGTEDRRRAARAGFDRHITKPADIERLEELIERLPGSDSSDC